MRPTTRTALVRGLPVLGVAIALLGALTWPLVFTHSGFAGDWGHHLWLMWHQSRSIESAHWPSLFLNSAYSVFYPTYAFYGGTLYAIGGLISLTLGHAPVTAYVLIYLLDFVAAFGGWYWLSRMAGVNRWLALIPGLIFITSAYYVLIVYVQGDWPEFTGVSMIPTMLAAGLSVLRDERLRLRAALALAASSVLFFGAHNITILLGLSTFALTGVAALALLADARRALTRRGVARVAAIVMPSAMVSAWYLLPALAYRSHTRIGNSTAEGVRLTAKLVSLHNLLDFSRTAAPGLSLPVLAIVWATVGAVVLTRGGGRAWSRLLLICVALGALIGIAMTHVGLLLALPHAYTLIQFSYRLETYVLLELCGAILAGLVLAQRGSRGARVWLWMAIPVCAVSLGGAIQQLGSFPYPGPDRYRTLTSYGLVATGDNRDFQDVSGPVIPDGPSSLTIQPAAVHDDSVSFSTSEPPGTLLATNIGSGPYLLHITGAEPVGTEETTGDLVLRIDPSTGSRAGARGGAAQTISVSVGHSAPIVLGRAIALAGLAILALELLGFAIVRLPFRRPRTAGVAWRGGGRRALP